MQHFKNPENNNEVYAFEDDVVVVNTGGVYSFEVHRVVLIEDTYKTIPAVISVTDGIETIVTPEYQEIDVPAHEGVIIQKLTKLPTTLVPIDDIELAALRTPSKDEIIIVLEGAVQVHLDTVARAKGYDSAAQCISYFNSTVAKWKTDATKMNKFRDDVWSFCQNELATAQTAPTKEALISMLPAAPW